MPILEHHDELGLPWDELADGRPYRLTKGRDFFRSPRAVEEAAQNAARRIGKVASVTQEFRSKKTFVWVQFADYQTELGQPCPGCGSFDLRAVNRRHTHCSSCESTVILVKPKRRKQQTDGFGTGPGGELLAALLAPGMVAPSLDLKQAKQPADVSEVSIEDMPEIVARAKEVAPLEQQKQWSRSGVNVHAAILFSGVFIDDSSPINVFDAEEEVSVRTLVDITSKRLDVRGGVVLNDVHGNARYRFVDGEVKRIARPGRYTFTLTIPPGTLAEGVYDARVAFALIKGGEFSRVTRRSAFSLGVTNGEPMEPWRGDPRSETVFLDYEWRIEEGQGPWDLPAAGTDSEEELSG
jgi:hypothetical protein